MNLKEYDKIWNLIEKHEDQLKKCNYGKIGQFGPNYTQQILRLLYSKLDNLHGIK